MRVSCPSSNCLSLCAWMVAPTRRHAGGARCEPASSFDRYPDFEPTHSGLWIELFAEALETRRVGDLVPRFRQPFAPDRVDRAADGRDMVAMGKHRIFLLAQPHATEGSGKIGKIGHFHSGDVVEVAVVVSVASNTERSPADLT